MLEYSNIPHLSIADLNSPQWLLLWRLWNAVYSYPQFEVRKCYRTESLAIDVIERMDGVVTHWYTRGVVGGYRSTAVNMYGLVGLPLLDLSDRRVILTEGVSDYLTVKLCNPSKNVLGFTTLGGNRVANKIVLALFDTFTVYSDNDLGADVNTGFRNAQRIKDKFEGFGKVVDIVLPALPYKDITEQVIADLKVGACVKKDLEI